MMSLITASAAEGANQGFSWLWSVIVPGSILLASIVLTFLLFRHFSKTEGGSG